MTSELVIPELAEHLDDGAGRPAFALVWRWPRPVRAVTSAVLGGGLGLRSWVFNATVHGDYQDPHPEAHAARIAASLGCEGEGVALLTGVDVRHAEHVGEDGAGVVATTGLGAVSRAAAPDGSHEQWLPGTINVVAWVPAPLSDAALVNLVATIAEAKAQALADAHVPATGTPTDAVAVCCPAADPPDDDDHRYGGPRSRWGARVARATHRAITTGIERESWSDR